MDFEGARPGRYDPGKPLAPYLYSCLSLLPDEQAVALRRCVPPRIPAPGLAEIAADLGQAQASVRGLIVEALDRIDATTGFRDALAPRLRSIAHDAPLGLESIIREGWARGIDPAFLFFFLEAFGGLHVVAVPGHGRFVVPFDEPLWEEANRLLRAAAVKASADGHPLSLTKGALGKLDAPPGARLACSRLFGRIYAGCDVMGIRERLGLSRQGGEDPSAKKATPAAGEEAPADVIRAGPSSDEPAPGPDAGSPTPEPPNAQPSSPSPRFAKRRTRACRGEPTFVQAGLLALEETRYALTFGELRDAIVERTGRQPSDASVKAALSIHGERLQGRRDLWRLRVDAQADVPGIRSESQASAVPVPVPPLPREPEPQQVAREEPRAQPAEPEWNPERDAILRTLWNAGESVRVIAERVGAGATHGNVMARVRGLGLF